MSVDPRDVRQIVVPAGAIPPSTLRDLGNGLTMIEIDGRPPMRPVAELIEHAAPYNPRKIAEQRLDALRRSLRTFGFVEPVVFNVRTQTVVGGHQRLRAAQAEGIELAPVVYVDLDEHGERQLNIALNNITGEWDATMLRDLLAQLQLEGADLSLTGFSDDELRALLAEEARTGLTEDDAVPETSETRVQPGDVWLLGPHRVACGDSTDVAVLERLMDGHQADLVLTDPPYNVDYAEGAIANDDLGAEFRPWLARALHAARHCAKDGAGLYVFHADTEVVAVRGALEDSGWRAAQGCVWVKDQLVLGRSDYHWQHEPCLYGWNPKGAHRWYGDRKQTTVWQFDRPKKSELHPTMKPVALLEYLLANSSRGGDVVLDPFGGSGSTLIAAAKLARHARLVELEARHCDSILQRWEEWSGEKAVRHV